MNRLCPKCWDKIARDAKSCTCGWVEETATPAGAVAQAVERSHAEIDARVRDEARVYCEERGLDTHEKRLEFIRTSMMDIKRTKITLKGRAA